MCPLGVRFHIPNTPPYTSHCACLGLVINMSSVNKNGTLKLTSCQYNQWEVNVMLKCMTSGCHCHCSCLLPFLGDLAPLKSIHTCLWPTLSMGHQYRRFAKLGHSILTHYLVQEIGRQKWLPIAIHVYCCQSCLNQ